MVGDYGVAQGKIMEKIRISFLCLLQRERCIEKGRVKIENDGGEHYRWERRGERCRRQGRDELVPNTTPSCYHKQTTWEPGVRGVVREEVLSGYLDGEGRVLKME